MPFIRRISDRNNINVVKTNNKKSKKFNTRSHSESSTGLTINRCIM